MRNLGYLSELFEHNLGKKTTQSQSPPKQGGVCIVFDNSEKHKKAKRNDENKPNIKLELILIKDKSNTLNNSFIYTRSILINHLAHTKYRYILLNENILQPSSSHLVSSLRVTSARSLFHSSTSGDSNRGCWCTAKDFSSRGWNFVTRLFRYSWSWLYSFLARSFLKCRRRLWMWCHCGTSK